MHNLNQTAQDNNRMPEFAKTQESLDLRGFWKTLVRQKKTIFSIVAVVLLLTLVFTLLSSPLYRATATLQVERETTPIGKDLTPDDIRDTRDYYQTQFELLRRYGLIDRVIDKLQLNNDIIRQSLTGKIRSAIFPPENGNDKSLLNTAISENLYIEPIKNSRLVSVHFEGATPEKSADVTNAIVETFVTMNVERKQQITSNTEKDLNESISKAKVKLEESENKLSTYARDNGILQLDNKESTTTSFAIMRLSEELVKAEREVITIRNDSSRKNEVQDARNRAEDIRDLLMDEERKAVELQGKTTTYKTLQREVETNQASYQGLLQNLKDIGVAGSTSANNVLVIDKAQVPLKKHKPKLSTNLAFASLLGLLLGLAVAFLREFMDDSVKDINDLERQTQLPVLGIVPTVREKNPRKMAQMALTEPRSTLAESFRTLRTTLRFKLREAQEKNTLFITSTRANEGKTTISINLASTYAHAGNRVLLIDADLRNPSIHKIMGGQDQHGLSGYLSGEVTLNQLAQASNVQNLDIVPAGKVAHDPAEMLASRRMEDLIQAATENYDMIIIDGPPILGLADAMILASLATLTVVAVDARNTQTTTINNALKRLRQSGLSVAGLLLNKVSDSAELGYEDDYYNYPVRA